MPMPEHAPTEEGRRMVEAMSRVGIPQETISQVLGIDPKTLRKHYRDELDNAEVKANADVARFLFTAASGEAIKDGATYADAIRAAMFWLKTRAGWKETDVHEHRGLNVTITGKDADL